MRDWVRDRMRDRASGVIVAQGGVRWRRVANRVICSAAFVSRPVMSGDSSKSGKSVAKKMTQEQIVAGFNQLRQEQRAMASKIVEVEADVNEHNLVSEALKNVDPDRKCYRLVGGVLVESTVGEVLPALESNREMISSVIGSLKEKVVSKGKEIGEYMEKHNIQIRQEGSLNDETAKAATDSKAAQPSTGVLVQN